MRVAAIALRVSALQRIDTLIADSRKKLDKAVALRDTAIANIIKSAARIKFEQRSLARLERRKREARAEELKARKAKRPAEDAMTVLG